MQKLKLKQSKKKSKRPVQGRKEESSQGKLQRMSLYALQKQKQIIELKEWLFIVGFIGIASLLRVPMQFIPNVEPLTFFAVLAGWLFGWKKGLITGAASLYVSNFLVFGGQGPWTIFQVAGYGMAGFLGGFLREKGGILDAVMGMLAATIAVQLFLNMSSAVLFGFNFFAALATGSAFILINMVSNVALAFVMPKARQFINEKGGFNEKELCNNLIDKLVGMPRHKSKQ